MKRLRQQLILTAIICAFGLSCTKPDVPVVDHTNLSLELAYASAKTAKISITYSDGEPYYVRIMKCVGYDTDEDGNVTMTFANITVLTNSRLVGEVSIPVYKTLENRAFREGDAFLLCSDGFWHGLKVEDMEKALRGEDMTDPRIP